MKRQLRSSLSFLIALISAAISQQDLIRHKSHYAPFPEVLQERGSCCWSTESSGLGKSSSSVIRDNLSPSGVAVQGLRDRAKLFSAAATL